ncbi:MAG: hypothetical protein ABUK01_05955 [Leptospirales bacterium]
MLILTFVIINTYHCRLKNSFAKGLDQIIYLPPSSFPELPSSIQHHLVTMGCQIPQPYYYNKTETFNVVHGNFTGSQ